MIRMKGLFYSRRNKLLFLFITALIFRIIVLLFVAPTQFPADGLGYHRLAVNWVKGNGLSNETEPPFSPFFFREPSYPLFLSIGLKIYDLFGGNVSYIDISNYNFHKDILDPIPGSVVFLRIWQAIFDSVNVMLLFLILTHIINDKKSFIIALCYALFLPVALHNGMIYREVFHTLILLVLNLFFVKYLQTKRRLFLLIFGVLWGVSNLTFQSTVYLFPFVFLMLLILFKSLRRALVDIMIVSGVMVTTVLPWLLYVYSFYPDIRIAKTFGCALTYEWIHYVSHHRLANHVGIISDSELKKFEVEKAYNRPYNEYFEKSFNGYYMHQCDSLWVLINKERESNSSMERLVLIGNNFFNHSVRNFWMKNNWSFPENGKYYLQNRIFLPLVLYAVSAFFAIICIMGFFKYFRSFLPILLIFFSYFGISYILGSESRRMLPSYPYVFSFGILFLIDLIQKFSSRYPLINSDKTKQGE